MPAEALSQDEIDALLSGYSAGGAREGAESAGVSADERHVLAQYQMVLARALTEVLTGLLSIDARVTPKEIKDAGPDTVTTVASPPQIAALVTYVRGLSGSTYLLFAQLEAEFVVSTLMGGAEITEFSDLELSAFAEVASQVFSAANAALIRTLGTEVVSQSAVASRLASEDALRKAAGTLGDRFVALGYAFSAGSVSGMLTQLVPNELIGALLSAQSAREAQAATPKVAGRGKPEAAPVEFAELVPSHEPVPRSLDLILDIGLTVRVELGQTRRQVRDILNLGKGAVIELNKLVGEPLDILVNDQLFARGEVVVIDENFGVRVTEILSQQERIEALKARSAES